MPPETNAPSAPKRNIRPALWRGAWGFCPQCNRGRLFARYLKTHSVCNHCDLRLDGHKADDAPPYITIFIVGHLVIPFALIVERNFEPPLYLFTFCLSALAIALCLALLPIVKGAIIALQWALRMHGFAPAGEHFDTSDYE